MGWDYEGYCEDITLEETDAVDIFTNEGAKPKNKDCTWFYQIFADGYVSEDLYCIEEQSGNATLCSCKECENFGTDVFEYFSIYQALKKIAENKPDISVSLWISSEKFLFDENECLFSSYDEVYKCAFLRTLGKDLGQLLEKLRVEIFHYEYLNKDIIPIFF